MAKYLYYLCDETRLTMMTRLTFIMSNSVFKTISIMMKYSNGVDTTSRHILYFILFLSFGMYLSSGLACMVKSIHDFWNTRYRQSLSSSISHHWLILLSLVRGARPGSYVQVVHVQWIAQEGGGTDPSQLALFSVSRTNFRFFFLNRNKPEFLIVSQKVL